MTRYSLFFCLLFFCTNLGYTQNQIPTDSFLVSVKEGYDDLDGLLEYYQANPETGQDSIERLLHIVNSNFLKNNPGLPYGIIHFRTIYFYDQFYRMKCKNDEITRDELLERDMQLQEWFIALNNHYDYYTNGLKYIDYSNTLQLLVLHSVATTETPFFELYYPQLAILYHNDFADLNLLKNTFDMYLKFRYKSNTSTLVLAKVWLMGKLIFYLKCLARKSFVF